MQAMADLSVRPDVVGEQSRTRDIESVHEIERCRDIRVGLAREAPC